MARLFIGNLPYDCQEDEIREMLKEFGVTTISMPKDRETQKFRGFAFADVTDENGAIAALNGGTFGERTIKISIAEDRGPRRGGQGGQGGKREFRPREQ